MFKTREEWLNNAIKELDKEFFNGKGYELPEKLQVSCGFPKGGKLAIGQCFDPSNSTNETTHIFICPTQDSPTRVLDILLHEMIHACVGCKEGHKGLFRKLAKEFGLEGKMTSTTVSEGSELHRILVLMAGRLGDYPHAAIKPSKTIKKGVNPWIRLVSPDNAAYTVVISPKKLEEFGAPKDPWGNVMEEKDA